ncbi:MAG: RsmD family RNA methyltransferase [Arcicella sp.]|nr:RsmD family RNA methyltransferase [Arcicella sp.]
MTERNNHSLSESEKIFIKTHQNDDVVQLLLQAQKFPTLDVKALVEQIKARQKAKIKLPEWTENENIVFPKMLSVEQCSSEITAKYKARLVQGESMIDLTGGMGVDVAYMSRNFEKAIYIEQNADLVTITQRNFQELGIHNVTFINGNSIDAFSETKEHFSWIYLDPHRRDDVGSKVVKLQDCEPNILKIKDLLFYKTDNILLKASPMLDIDSAVNELGNVSKIYVVAVDNEVKEVLFHLTKIQTEPIIHAVNLSSKNNSTQTLSFTKLEEKNTSIQITSPKQYLYEPNAAILKAGAFRFTAQYFDLQKVAPHSHLYTADKLVTNFQGRIFKIIAVCKLDKKEIAKHLTEDKANISTRNFPLTVKQIREKLKLSDGGNEYLFATTDAQNQKIVIVCRK